MAAATGGYDNVFNRNAPALGWDAYRRLHGQREQAPALERYQQQRQPENGSSRFLLGSGLWQFKNSSRVACVWITPARPANGVQMTQWQCQSGNTNQEFSLTQEP